MKLLSIFIIIVLFSSCITENCPEGINKLPMYGNKTKCKSQIQIDEDFIKECDDLFNNRKAASKFHIDWAWGYFYKNHLDTAIMRFNQAWLLDSLNPDVYWGYGNILGMQKDYKSSINYFEKSIKLNPNNPKVLESSSTSYLHLFFQTKDEKLLNKSIENLKKSLHLDSDNARALGQLTAAYSYFYQKDSALKYLELTDAIEPGMINPEVRKILKAE